MTSEGDIVFPKVLGVCPHCYREELLLDTDGAVLCGWEKCEDPSRMSRLMMMVIPHDRFIEDHLLTIDTNYSYYMTHPLDCELRSCAFSAQAEQWVQERNLPERGTYMWSYCNDGEILLVKADHKHRY